MLKIERAKEIFRRLKADRRNQRRMLAKKLLLKSGYIVSPEKMSKQYLHSLGFSPKTVIDVGVNRGTPGLYQAFENSTIVLVDPRQESIDKTVKAFNNYHFVTQVCAAGSQPGEATLSIPKSGGGRSSFYERASLTASEIVETREVSVERLDHLASALNLSGPFGIKIDTEGYELEVLKGAKGILSETDFVIAEVSIKRRFENGYRFSDIILFMRQEGFELLDTMSFGFKPRRFIDCLFVKSESSLFG